MTSQTGSFTWAGYLLGFALGGFFDGILLHQILQWHHLLSGLDGDAFRDIRVQILADGIFHALMYAVAAAGLAALWRARRDLGEPRSGRRLVAEALMGFGVWHVVDTLVSHWITGIHRIRMDSPNPLLWDLIWLAAFGILPIVVAAVLRRGQGRAGGRAVAALLVAAVVGGGVVGGLPPPGVSQVMVYFRPGTSAEAVFAAAAAVDGRVVWSDRSGELWAFHLADPARASGLYRYGALFVGDRFFPAACAAWSRPG